MAKNLKELTPEEILALAITSEEENGRIYADLAERMRKDYPDTAKTLQAMHDEEDGHRRRLIELYQSRFGQHSPIRIGGNRPLVDWLSWPQTFPMKRKFSIAEPELIDPPDQDEVELQRDLVILGQMNRFFGARRAVDGLFRLLSGTQKNITLVDLASGYGDHGRNIIDKAKARQQSVTVIAVDQQHQTLRISRRAATSDRQFFFVQADARRLPFVVIAPISSSAVLRCIILRARTR